jgi:predicted NUDIX family NTP pyrophosphohydrolase
MAGLTRTKLQSAGIFLFRNAGSEVQVLLGRLGGLFWSKKDLGVWTIPKGLIDPGEESARSSAA